jgi:chromosome partitioning protein
MTQVIALVSSKGGTGKTTAALNLSVALAERGRRVLLVDLDPQGSIGLSLARGDTDWAGIVEFISSGLPIDEAIITTKLTGLDILPRGSLDPVDVCNYERHLAESDVLRTVVEAAAVDRDYLILDCPSGLGLVTRAGLAVATLALMPLQAEPLALRAFTQTLRVLDHVRQHENPELELLGVLPTMVELRREPSMNVMATIWAHMDGVLETVIPRAEVFARASEAGVPVSFLAGATPPEARRFELLADELETTIANLKGPEEVDDESVHRQLV